MTNPHGDKPRNQRFLDALVQELQTMSDTDALEGEGAEDLVKLGERLLRNAHEEAGKLRMADAKRKLSVVSGAPSAAAGISVAEAKKFLASHPKLTLAARGLNELSDADVLDLFRQAMSLEDAPTVDAEDHKE
jgi:hypothetical protein